MISPNQNAYPDGGVTHQNGQVEWGQPGLTKRELFAAMALQGMMSAEAPDVEYHADATARRAVGFADALLAELAKPAKEGV